MLPASNQGLGMNMGMPDVCLTPAAPAPIPIPYPNLGMNAMSMPFCPTILVSMAPAQNMASKPLMTNGDNAGVAHPLCMQPGGLTMGNPRILMTGMPASHLGCPSYGNNFNNPVGAKTVPSVTNVFLGDVRAGEAGALRELWGAEPLGLGVAVDETGLVLHARRGGLGARAGLRRGDRVLAVAPSPCGGVCVKAESAWNGNKRSLVAASLGHHYLPVRSRWLGMGSLEVVLDSFAFGVTAWVRSKLQATEPRALVLDLRANPGGSVAEARALVDVLRTRSSFDLRVLVDDQTASAAELCAALLQDAGACIEGTPTFGKTVATSVDGSRVIRMERSAGVPLQRVIPGALFHG